MGTAFSRRATSQQHPVLASASPTIEPSGLGFIGFRNQNTGVISEYLTGTSNIRALMIRMWETLF